MVGVLLHAPGRMTVAVQLLAGLTVLAVTVPPEPTAWQLKKAGKRFRRQGVSRVLTRDGFAPWERLREYGLSPVDPLPFLQAMAPKLAVAYLARRGISPESATVALRGERVTGALYAAAEGLCPLVSHLVVDAKEGGQKLRAALNQTAGLAPLPKEYLGQVALCFSPGLAQKGEPELGFYPGGNLLGLTLCADGHRLPDCCAPLSLLALLWEAERLDPADFLVCAAETA